MPSAKFILTVRDPNRWFSSAQAMRPIMQAAMPNDDLADNPAQEGKLSAVVPPEIAAILKFQDPNSVMGAFERFNRGVQKVIPADRLLVFDVKRGWQPLCDFLGVPIPNAPFPHVNSIEEFPSRIQRMVEREYAKKPAGAAH